MPSIHQYFETDFPGILTADFPLTIIVDENEVPIEERIVLDFAGRVKYLIFYIGNSDTPLLRTIETICGGWPTLLQIPKAKLLIPRATTMPVGTQIAINQPAENLVVVSYTVPDNETITSDELFTSGKIFFYSETELRDENKHRIAAIARASNIILEFRSTKYAASRTHEQQPIAFISHDSRDKNDIVRPLVNALQAMMVPLWYDEFSLTVGNNLRESIEKGLRECSKCILILTPNFLSNTGWTKAEFDAIFTRELIERQDIILPVWAGVSHREVYDYSMILAGRLGLNWDLGIDEISKRLFRQLVPPAR